MHHITRRIQFSAGHRVFGHESKCAYPHGHNYVAYVHARAAELDSLGRVIDFGVLKDIVGGWIDRCWDHAFLVYERDDELIDALQGLSGKSRLVVLPVNPTAENLAIHLLNEVCPKIMPEGSGVEVYSIELWETENCKASATAIDKLG